MTNNQLTKEWLQQTIAELESVRDEIPFGIDTNSELELAAFKIALAAMDSEPVKWSNGCDKSAPAALRYLAENERPSGGSSKFNTEQLYQLAREIELMAEESLYRHAQPAPVVMDDEKLRALFDAWFASDCSFNQSPEASEADNIAWRESYWYVWQRCRAAMFQAGNSPAIPGAWIPVSERMPDDSSDVLCTAEFDGPGDWRKKVGYWHEGKWVVYGASWTPTHWMPLPAAPKEVK